ncbi:hypothetical protein KC359_g164 [Hortaea werneckii]|nr:hypothetical protein KC359_g164 [Hortaea werneckii]
MALTGQNGSPMVDSWPPGISSCSSALVEMLNWTRGRQQAHSRLSHTYQELARTRMIWGDRKGEAEYASKASFQSPFFCYMRGSWAASEGMGRKVLKDRGLLLNASHIAPGCSMLSEVDFQRIHIVHTALYCSTLRQRGSASMEASEPQSRSPPLKPAARDTSLRQTPINREHSLAATPAATVIHSCFSYKLASAFASYARTKHRQLGASGTASHHRPEGTWS